ncbi:HAD family hydrolase [Streptomyces sp. NPDC091280]|uniref:HAD family hydrolase n=1 Tax=Streptomyces sp. NPDC091280 TaxID=3365984 RepID=UPI00380EB9D5
MSSLDTAAPGAGASDERKVVVFDLGEVLASPADLHERLARLIGHDPVAEERAYWNHRDAYDRGGSAQEYWTRVLAELQATHTAELVDDLTRMDTEAWVAIRDDASVLLETLHTAGVPVAILSNATPEMAVAARTTPWAQWIDHWFFSSELGMAKPDLALYRHVQSVLEVSPGQITFLDDRPVNVEGARTAGWNAYLWTSGEQASTDLVDAGFLTKESPSRPGVVG